MSSFRLTVPGNLLLAGEYAVLEEGGLGAAVAVEPRLTVTVFPDDHWLIDGRWVGGQERWDPESGGEPTFAGRVFLKALELLEARGDERGRRWSRRVPTARIEIDSSDFFDSSGRKLGYGSSAALAAGLTAALARLGDRDETLVHQMAVAAHRSAQGGAGSGYDVTVSWFGGFGLFVGGAEPTWQPSGADLPRLALFPGPEAVRTVGSIARYRQWKADFPGRAHDFLDASNAAVAQMVKASSQTALVEAWSAARQLGLGLGQFIGSDASLTVPPGLPPDTFVKALGAGNETGVAVLPPQGPSGLAPGLVPLEISREGLRWGIAAEARAKLLLFGEHSAVYGHPAVGLSLPWRLRVVYTPGPVWDLPGLGAYEPAVRALLDRLDALAVEARQPRPTPGRLEFSTEIPLGTGFGSSGALCAVLVTLFFSPPSAFGEGPAGLAGRGPVPRNAFGNRYRAGAQEGLVVAGHLDPARHGGASPQA